MPIVILCFWIGLYPKPFFAVLEKPVDYIVRKVDADYAANVATLPAAEVATEAPAEVAD